MTLHTPITANMKSNSGINKRFLFNVPCYSQVIVGKSTLLVFWVCGACLFQALPNYSLLCADCRPRVKAESMYFPLVYDEYSSLPPLILLRVRFFIKMRDQLKRIRTIRIFRREKKWYIRNRIIFKHEPTISMVFRPKKRQLDCLSIQP